VATYYISPDGSNSDNGLGPDASHGTNRPWLTLGKALNTGSAVVPGDTVYVGPGVYYQAGTSTPIAGISSSASPTSIVGDPTNARGFKNGSGVRLAPNLVVWTTRSSGDAEDGNAYTSGAPLVTGNTNGTDGLRISYIVLEARPDVAIIQLSPAANVDWILENCLLLGGQVLAWINAAPTAGRNTIIRGCDCMTGAVLTSAINTAAATADADLNILVESNRIIGRATVNAMSLAASGGNLAGGVRFKGNTFALITQTAISTTAARVSTVTPIYIEGNLFLGGLAVSAGTSGHVVSAGYNRFYRTSASVNFTADGTDKDWPFPRVYFPILTKWGLQLPRTDVLGWLADAASTVRATAWTNTNSDWWGRTARPWAGGASVGCLEAGDLSQDTGSQITGGGANSLKITGAGEVSLYIPVNAAATVVTVTTESSSYGGSNYPQMILQANPSIGVTSETVLASSASEQTLATASFTPTAAGVVELRLVSRSSSTTSSTYFDLLGRT
jgi:hypothetical protein